MFYGASISEVTESSVDASEKVSLQLSSEQSLGDVYIAQLVSIVLVSAAD